MTAQDVHDEGNLCAGPSEFAAYWFCSSSGGNMTKPNLIIRSNYKIKRCLGSLDFALVAA